MQFRGFAGRQAGRLAEERRWRAPWLGGGGSQPCQYRGGVGRPARQAAAASGSVEPAPASYQRTAQIRPHSRANVRARRRPTLTPAAASRPAHPPAEGVHQPGRGTAPHFHGGQQGADHHQPRRRAARAQAALCAGRRHPRHEGGRVQVALRAGRAAGGSKRGSFHSEMQQAALRVGRAAGRPAGLPGPTRGGRH